MFTFVIVRNQLLFLSAGEGIGKPVSKGADRPRRPRRSSGETLPRERTFRDACGKVMKSL